MTARPRWCCIAPCFPLVCLKRAAKPEQENQMDLYASERDDPTHTAGLLN